MRPGREGNFHRVTSRLGRGFDRRAATEHDQVGQRDFLAVPWALLKACWMPSSVESTLASCAGWLTSQSFCGARRMRAPLAPPRLSEPRNVDAEAQAVDTSSEVESPKPGSWLSGQRYRWHPQGMIHSGERVLPDQVFGRDFRAEVEYFRAHIAVGQFEPGAGEGISEGFRILVEAARDFS
jgi:hypothetical protein